MGGNVAAYHLLGIAARQLPVGEVSAHAGLPAGRARRTNITSGTTRARIEGAPAGKLKGKKVALKDNVCVAGVPMMNGASDAGRLRTLTSTPRG